MPYPRNSRKVSGFVNPKFRKKLNAVVKRTLNRQLETKFRHFTQSATALSTGAVGLLFTVSQGSGESGRLGNSIRLRSLELNHHVTNPAAATYTTRLRVIYFVDKRQDYATAPSVATVLESADVHSPLAIGYTGRMKILSDRTFALTPKWSGQSVAINQKIRINMKDLEQIYDNATTSLVKNGIYRLVISNDPTNPPTLSGHTCVRYKDA